MNNTQWYLITAIMGAVLGSDLLHAQSETKCKAIEFAELQSLNKVELEAEFCKNKKKVEAAKKRQQNSKKLAVEYYDLASQYIAARDKSGEEAALKDARDLSARATSFAADAANCEGENERIKRLLSKQNFAPQCK